jgi:hypothetical protein
MNVPSSNGGRRFGVMGSRRRHSGGEARRSGLDQVVVDISTPPYRSVPRAARPSAFGVLAAEEDDGRVRNRTLARVASANKRSIYANKRSIAGLLFRPGFWLL